MAISVIPRLLYNELRQNCKFRNGFLSHIKPYSTKIQQVTQEKTDDSLKPTSNKSINPVDYRFIYPEFLPDPKIEWRNHIREKLERKDMLDRRAHIDIPEFYVGTIMAVTSSDVHSEGKIHRFAGICIYRSGCGLRSQFILRNVIDHQGCEVMYEMYDPTIQKIEILKLEKRLDSTLFYLRDALPEYSTFPTDMDPEILPEGTPVPVNDIKVKLKPRPWLERWERQDLKGIESLDLPEKFFKKAELRKKPWEKYDLMKQYRSSIPEEEQNVIYAEVYSELHQLELTRRKQKRRRTYIKPVKKA